MLCALIAANGPAVGGSAARYTLSPRWPLITLEVLLLVVLVILNPVRV